MPGMRRPRLSTTPDSGGGQQRDLPSARVPKLEVRHHLHQHAASTERGDGRGPGRGLRDCDDADLFFRGDAERLGYLAPGGKGLWAYYRDHGIHPPEYLRRTVNRKELTMGDAVNLIEDDK
jgi:hypothetical protein